MKFEFSAGGIVFKRRTKQKKRNAQNNAENIYILVSQHSGHHGWVFPKGLIDKKELGIRNHESGTVRETKEEAALREVKEETGIIGRIIKPLTPITYWYKFENERIKKTVYYFLMEYVSGDIKDHDFEMENVEWLPMDEVKNRLTYKSDKEVWRETMRILNIKD